MPTNGGLVFDETCEPVTGVDHHRIDRGQVLWQELLLSRLLSMTGEAPTPTPIVARTVAWLTLTIIVVLLVILFAATLSPKKAAS